MFEQFLDGSLALFSNPTSIAIFIGGLLGGMVFGAIPGVSMLTLAAILLPFTANLSASDGIMLFSVIYCAGVFGGAITAILFNIPGAPENAPTAFDGYPMTRKGLAGKAVGAAVLCSAFGGTCSALLMMFATEPIANWAISNFGPPEIFALVFFGLAVGVGLIGAMLVPKKVRQRLALEAAAAGRRRPSLRKWPGCGSRKRNRTEVRQRVRRPLNSYCATGLPTCPRYSPA